MAGFQVIIYGRFWVFTEVSADSHATCVWVVQSLGALA
jgi:hypothetical protein